MVQFIWFLDYHKSSSRKTRVLSEKNKNMWDSDDLVLTRRDTIKADARKLSKNSSMLLRSLRTKVWALSAGLGAAPIAAPLWLSVCDQTKLAKTERLSTGILRVARSSENELWEIV